jgi:hypothetical protein
MRTAGSSALSRSGRPTEPSVQASRAFFDALGFSFDEKFCDEQAA